MTPRGFTQYKYTAQERLSKDDIRLLLEIMRKADLTKLDVTDTRLTLMLGKLIRMEKQK